MYSRYNLFAFLLGTILFFLNLYRSQSLPDLQMAGWLPFDKFAHCVQFIVLSFITTVGFAKQSKSKMIQYNPMQYSIIICGIFAIILELWQFYFLYQYFQILDSLANFIGIFIGILIFLLIHKKINLFSKIN